MALRFIEALTFSKLRVDKSPLVRMDFLESPLKQAFDVIGVFDVIEHVDDDKLFLSALFNSIIPGGGALITVPQHPFLWSPWDEIAHHRRRYTRADLSEKLLETGFRPIRIVSFISFLFPLLVASRRLSRIHNSGSWFREFKIPSALNSFLRATCNLEFNLIRKGFELPLGGSLMAIVERPC